jgi:hypothetical protein
MTLNMTLSRRGVAASEHEMGEKAGLLTAWSHVRTVPTRSPTASHGTRRSVDSCYQAAFRQARLLSRRAGAGSQIRYNLLRAASLIPRMGT